MLGRAEPTYEGPATAESDGFVRTMTAGLRATTRITPLEVSSLLNDMQFSALTSTDEFKALAASKNLNLDFSEPPSFEQLKSNTLEVLALYNLLSICTRFLIQKQMERVFAPYLATQK